MNRNSSLDAPQQQFHCIQMLIITIYWVMRGTLLVLMLFLLTDQGAGFGSLDFLRCRLLPLFMT